MFTHMMHHGKRAIGLRKKSDKKKMSKRSREETTEHRHRDSLSSSQQRSPKDSIQFLISFHISNKKCEQDVIRKIMAAINVEEASCKHDHRSGQFNRHLVTIPKISTSGNKEKDNSHMTIDKVKVMFALDIAAKKFGVMEYNPTVALKGKLVRAEKHKKKRDATLQKRRLMHQDQEAPEGGNEPLTLNSEAVDNGETNNIQSLDFEMEADTDPLDEIEQS